MLGHDHGRERLLRDHPRAPEARGGDGGEARAGRRRRCSRRRTARCTTTTSRCPCCSRCSPATSRSCSAPTTRGSSSSRSRFSPRSSVCSSTAGTRARREWWIPALAAAAVVGLALWLQPEETAPAVPDAAATFAQVAADDTAALRAVPLGRVRAARDPLRDAGADRGPRRRTSSARRCRRRRCRRATQPASPTRSGAPRSLGRSR